MRQVLANRAEFERLCSSRKSDCRRADEINAVLLIEPCDINQIMVTDGIDEFDRIMDEFALRIGNFLDDYPDGTASRFGEGLFVMAVHNLARESDVDDLCSRLARELKVLRKSGGMSGVKIGAALCRHDPERGYKCAFDDAVKALEKARMGGADHVFVGGGKDGRREPYNVMIVEDQEMVRQFLEKTVNDSDRYELIFSIRNADLADVYCEKNSIDLILMDVYTDMGADGLDAASRIKKRNPGIRIIIMTSMPEFSYLKKAREAGVDSFMYKEIAKDPILDVMDRTMAGESIYPDRTPEVVLGFASSYDFSERELEVLRELTSGDTNEEIAARLNISTATVKTHINNMMNKTGFKSRTELAIRAREAGLVILGK